MEFVTEKWSVFGFYTTLPNVNHISCTFAFRCFVLYYNLHKFSNIDNETYLYFVLSLQLINTNFYQLNISPKKLLLLMFFI